jgi:hypothetical protein
MPNSGLTTTTGERLITTVGMLWIANTQRGVLEASATVNPGTRIDNVAFAGKSHAVAGLDRVISHDASIEVTFKEIDTVLLGLLTPGSTVVTAGGVTTRTPARPGGWLTPIDSVRAIFGLGNGMFYEFRLHRAMPSRGAIGGGWPETGTMPVTFEGRSHASDPDDPPNRELIYSGSIPTV